MDRADAIEGMGAPFPIVGVGASAGGLAAAGALLERIPADTGMAFVLVFHASPRRKSKAARLLQPHSRMPVAQVRGRTRIEPDHVYVVPPNHAASIDHGELRLTRLARADGRPTVIDHFFRSLAAYAGERAIGVILPDSGSEGSQGLKAIKQAGGVVMVQDETGAAYDGTLHSAVATGLVECVLPGEEIPSRLLGLRDFPAHLAPPTSGRVAGGDHDPGILVEPDPTDPRRSRHTAIEEMETSSEEPRASNAELQSVHGELQSTSAEFETREELLAANAKLLAVSQELQARNDALAYSQSDLVNLIASAEIAALFLDTDLKVRRYTPRATTLFNLMPGDMGRPFAQLTCKFEGAGLVADAERAARGLEVVERELASTDGGFYLASSRPCRVGNRVDGVVLTFVDITEHHRHEQEVAALNVELGHRNAYAEAIVETVREPLLVLDADLRVVSASRAFYLTFETTSRPTERVLLYELGNGQWDIPELRRLLGEILPRRTAVEGFEVRHDFGHGERVMRLNARRLRQEGGSEPLILVSFEDVTDRTRAVEFLHRSNERKRFLLQIFDRLRLAANPRDLQAIVVRRLCRYLDADRVCCVEFDLARQVVTAVADHARADMPDMAGEYPAASFRALLGAVAAGKPVVSADAESEPQLQLALPACRLLGARALVVVPRVQDGAVAAGMCVVASGPRTWTEHEVQLVQEVAERAWGVIERARMQAMLAESEQKYRGLINSMAEGVQILDLFRDEDGRVVDYRFVEVNPAFAVHTGLHDAVGKRMSEVAPATERSWLDACGEVARTGRSTRIEGYHAASGRWYSAFVLTSGSPSRDRVVVFFSDVSERKRRERNLALFTDVADELMRMDDVGKTMARVVAKIGIHFNAIGCVVAEPVDAAGSIRVEHEWLRAGIPGCKGEHRLANYCHAPLQNRWRHGEIAIVPDVTREPDVDAGRLAAHAITAFLAAPVVRAGDWRFLLAVFDRAPRAWWREDVILMRELAERIAARLEQTRADSALIASETRYRSLFDSIDEGFCIFEMIHDPDGTPVDYRFLMVNPAFYRHTGLQPPAEGRTMRELVREHEQSWFDTYDRVAATGEPVRFEQRAPGMSRIFDVYAFRVDGPETGQVSALFTNVTQRKQQERSLLQLASIVDTSDDAIVSKDLHGVITTWNKAAERMFGWRAGEAIGTPITALIIPPDRMEEETDILTRITRGETIDHFETVRSRKDGSLIHVSVTISPLSNRRGEIVGASKIARDISERKIAEDHRELLIHELNHRVKNTLATVQALAAQTFREPAEKNGLSIFEARLLALSGAHNVLTQESWKGAWLRNIVDRALEPWAGWRGSRIRVAGPDLRLRPSTALAIAMALHELATNATKYGALSIEGGEVAIEWSTVHDAQHQFRLEWRESGGPPVRVPSRRGFGSRLVERGLAQDLGGHVELAFDPAGVVCVVEAPMDEVGEQDIAP